MGSSSHPVDHIKNSGLASDFDSSAGKSQVTSNGLPPNEGIFSVGVLQEQYQGKSKDSSLATSNYGLTE
jgi:hypothetical protein